MSSLTIGSLIVLVCACVFALFIHFTTKETKETKQTKLKI